MSSDQSTWRIPPFPAGYRGSGVLLHVMSLPSRYGIGDLGPGAIACVDLLCQAGQTWWHALPLRAARCGQLPCQSFSSFAGYWPLISPDELIEDGLIELSDCKGWSFPPNVVNFEIVLSFKRSILATAWKNFAYGVRSGLRLRYEQFCRSHAYWLDDYALFSALKARYGEAPYVTWPADLVHRAPAAIVQARRALTNEMQRVRFAQFLFYRQAERLREYARGKGLHLIGDLSFFAPSDSSDVWANPELFDLDEELRPRFAASAPPHPSATAQHSTNPAYNWDAMRQTGYSWWLERLRVTLLQFDAITFDNFGGFAGAPCATATGESGISVRGPGADFFRTIRPELGTLPLIAGARSIITPDAALLGDQFQVPSTRILQLAFDGNPANTHLPRNYRHNTIAYTGTHDTNTTRSWFEGLPDQDRKHLWNYIGDRIKSDEVVSALMQMAWFSRAAVTFAPIEDLLNLGTEFRGNVDGQTNNRAWRCTENVLSPSAFQALRDLTKASGRCGDPEQQHTGAAVQVAS